MSNLKKELLMKSDEGQAGSSLYLAIIVLIILLAIVVGLTAILISQMRMVRQMGYSVLALSAADAGIERTMVDQENPVDGFIGSLSENNATYTISVLNGPITTGGPGEEYCTSTDWSYCITSVGEYGGVRRAIEVVY